MRLVQQHGPPRLVPTIAEDPVWGVHADASLRAVGFQIQRVVGGASRSIPFNVTAVQEKEKIDRLRTLVILCEIQLHATEAEHPKGAESADAWTSLMLTAVAECSPPTLAPNPHGSWTIEH